MKIDSTRLLWGVSALLFIVLVIFVTAPAPNSQGQVMTTSCLDKLRPSRFGLDSVDAQFIAKECTITNVTFANPNNEMRKYSGKSSYIEKWELVKGSERATLTISGESFAMSTWSSLTFDASRGDNPALRQSVFNALCAYVKSRNSTTPMCDQETIIPKTIIINDNSGPGGYIQGSYS